MLFMHMLSEVVKMCDHIKSLDKEYDDSQGLADFIGKVTHFFNNGKTYPDEFMSNIERFFKVRWQEDKNQIIYDSEDSKIFEQLPP